LSSVDPKRAELLILGFACGFAFNFWWWESWWAGLVAANWIALTWQVGEAKLRHSVLRE
jgi:hypothetical protein